jgi:hypothetical protein
MSAAPEPPREGWKASLTDPIGAALRAREDVWAGIPWWWRRLHKLLLKNAVEVYVQAVLRAYVKGAIKGWPPGPDGTPTVDMALRPRRQRRPARRVNMGARRQAR